MDRSSTLKARQIKAARALLDWSQGDLSSATGLSIATIRKFELGHISPRGKTINSIRRALEDAGLEFLEPDGVRHRPDDITIYQGSEGYADFFEDVYKFAKNKNGEIVIVTPSALPFDNAAGGDTTHLERMAAIKDRVSVKCILTEDKETLTASSYCEYRWISKHYVDSVPFYVYGDKYAIFVFDIDPSPKITVIQSRAVAEAFRRQFHSMWEKATPLSRPNLKDTNLRKRVSG